MIRLHSNITYLLFVIFISFGVIVSFTFANEDFIIVLDQSMSMKESVPGNPSKGYEKDPFKSVKSKGAIDAINHVVNSFLKEGDYFSLIIFGSKSELILSQEIRYKHERELIKNYVKSLVFNDQKTDIIAGIKQASDLISSLDTPQRRKLLIMITDGVNDPPSNSPYALQEQQDIIFQHLQETIRFNKWDVTLVGLGEHTDINNIADRLGLPLENAIHVKDQLESDITQSLTSIIQKEQDSVIKMAEGVIVLKIRPKPFGGYETGQTFITLQSSFKEKTVQIYLNTLNPLILKNDTLINKNNDMMKVNITSFDISLPPQQSVQLKLTIAFQGKRPEEGRVIRDFEFNFAEGSDRFFPFNGSIEVILISWWEIFGLYAIIAIYLVLFMFVYLIWAIRRAQVPEIRAVVTANDIPLGDPFTLKRKDTFMIANEYFEGRAVVARGLNCKIAAKVRYLGKRKFSVESVEAKIVDEGKEADKITIGTDKFFDLRDKEGKFLRLITITKPGRESDPFGGTHGKDTF